MAHIKESSAQAELYRYEGCPMLDPIDTLSELRKDYWHAAFGQARQCGLTIVGVYDPEFDRGLMFMYWAGGPL